MAAGLVPAVITAMLMGAALLWLGFALPGIVIWATPWAETWQLWATLGVRIVLGIAVFVAALALAVFTFTAITLLIGEPFYDRIWKSVETGQAGEVPAADYGFWRSVGDSFSLILRGIGVALVSLLIGLVPVVGGFLAVVLSLTLSGWVLADELSARSLAARGINAPERARLRQTNRARTLGFGVATAACFLIPIGAIFTMPAAVAGSTLLAHDLLKFPSE